MNLSFGENKQIKYRHEYRIQLGTTVTVIKCCIAVNGRSERLVQLAEGQPDKYYNSVKQPYKQANSWTKTSDRGPRSGFISCSLSPAKLKASLVPD